MKKLSFAVIIVFALVLLGGMISVAQAEQKVISLNKATVKDLQEEISLPNALCKAIVEYRTKNGRFKDRNGLLKVPGMTRTWIEKINPVVKNGDLVYDPDAEPVLMPSKC
jgi:competence ComEA-like helix-hairpin-helix protein